MKTRTPKFSLSALVSEVASALDVIGEKEAFDYGDTDTDAIEDHRHENHTHKTLPNKQLDLLEVVTFNGPRGLEKVEERISFSEFIAPKKSGREKTITAIIQFFEIG